MSCTVYIVYKSNLSLHHANFGQFKAKQVLLMYFPSFGHPVSEIDTLAAGPAYYVLHPQKVLPFVFFFNLPGLQKPGRNRFPKTSCLKI